MLIRSGIFFVAGLVTITFIERLNELKNRLLVKLHLKPKDERKQYVYFGIAFFIISAILLIYGLTQ